MIFTYSFAFFTMYWYITNKQCPMTRAGTLVPSLGDVPCIRQCTNNWKLADITPLPKKAAENVRENYRPISPTSVVCKVCEIINNYSMRPRWI